MAKSFGKRAPAGSMNWRKDKSMQSFAAPNDLKNKLNKYCKKQKIAKSQVIRDAIELILTGDNTMAKTKAFDWKGLVTTLHELNADVTAAKLSEFIASKGVNVSTRSIGAVRANLSR